NEPADAAVPAATGLAPAAGAADAELADVDGELAEPADRPIREPAASVPETDLDDQTSVMGDSVHTYLKSIGRRQLLTAEQEVDLAKRIEAGLYAEHKLETEARLDDGHRGDLEAVAADGR